MAKVRMRMNKDLPLPIPLINEFALQSVKNNESHLWHLRYGHLNYKGLHLLKKKNMVIGLPNISSLDKVCEGCVYGKMHRLPLLSRP